MAILRWSASRELMFLHSTMGKVFEEALMALQADARVPSPWIPPCDIYETADNFVLKAEAPGVDLDDIVLCIDNNAVTLSGQRKPKPDAGNIVYHRLEKSGERFTRSFALPFNVDVQRVSATLKDGLLTVTLPKKTASAVAKVIEIKPTM